MSGPLVKSSSANTAVLFLSLLAGCAVAPIDPQAPLDSVPQPAACLALFESNDRLIDRAGARDAQDARISGFPFLRTNRFFSSLRDRLTSAEERETWIEYLSGLDLEGRQIELHNLPARTRPPDTEIDAIGRCRKVLIQHALSDPATFEDLRSRAIVPDSYRTWARILGLYPLASLFVLNGVDRLQATEGAHFNRNGDSIYAPGERTAYGLAANDSGENIDQIVREARRDALGIPRIDHDRMTTLFERHSPIWSISSRSHDDRIGTVQYDAKHITIDTGSPTLYTHLSYTKFDGDVLLQLNYTIWFPARPKQGAFDLLGGAIDGITWRTTLDTNGRLLAADAMHNCGCYYMAFPTTRIRARERLRRFEEPLWIPENFTSNEYKRVVIHVSSDAHYIRQVELINDPPRHSKLESVEYDKLRSLATAHGGYQSLFEPNGLIKGSERSERWLLWPMGIASAGAMRQIGHHAIAFVGRRHFDDPDLLEAYFERARSD